MGKQPNTFCHPLTIYYLQTLTSKGRSQGYAPGVCIWGATRVTRCKINSHLDSVFGLVTKLTAFEHALRVLHVLIVLQRPHAELILPRRTL